MIIFLCFKIGGLIRNGIGSNVWFGVFFCFRRDARRASSLRLNPHFVIMFITIGSDHGLYGHENDLGVSVVPEWEQKKYG